MRKSLIIMLFLVLCFITLNAEIKYSLVKVYCPSDLELKQLLKDGFDVLTQKGIKNNQVEVVAHQDDLKKLKDRAYSYEIVYEDFSAFQRSRLTQPRTPTIQIGQGSLGGYFTYPEMMSFVDSLHNAYPSIMSNLQVIGQTVEGLDIKAYKLSDNPNSEENEPRTLITGLHHAREPMSIVAPLYYTQWLLENYGTNPLATYLINEREIWIIPILNIDGYLYNQQISPGGGGMWRKNKADNNNNGAFNNNYDGVDLNRNYGFEWGYDNEGSSNEPSAETYRGPSAFSEPETQAIRDFCIAKGFKTALSFHTFGDLFIYTGHANGDPVEDTALLQEYAVTMTKDNGYTYGNGMETVNYTTNGDSDAWMYGDQTSKPKIISYTPEIGDQLDYFWAPTDRIIPLAQENLFSQQYITLIAGAYLQVMNTRVNDSTGGDNNHFGEAGETFDLYVKIKNKGWNTSISNVNAVLSCTDPMVTINNSSANITSLNALQEIEIHFNITLSAQMTSGHKSQFSIQMSNTQGYNLTESFTHVFGTPFIVFYDNAENGFSNWTTNGLWNIDPQKSASGQFSFSDSPGRNYANNSNTKMMLTQGIDLSQANNAYLNYKIRWDMERHYDKAQVAFLNSNNQWVYQDGQYMTYGTGAGVQTTGEPLYNGYRDLQWFDEEIEITQNFQGSNFKMAYSLASDEGITAEGVFVDDIMVISYTDQQFPPYFAYVSDQLPNTSFLGPYPVQAIVSDPQGLTGVQLKYSTNNNQFLTVNMTETTPHYYSANIPGMTLGTTVYYYFSATDAQNNTTNSPVNQFLVTNIPPEIAVNAGFIDLTVNGVGSVNSTFEIENNGELPLEYQIYATTAIPVRNLPKRDLLDIEKINNTIRNSQLNSQKKLSQPHLNSIQDREMTLIIEDALDENEDIYPDIHTIYGEVANGNLNLQINLDNTINWANTILVISIDTDQNINTGAYPPGLGICTESQNIGSEREMIVDPGNQLGNGSVAILLDEVGENAFAVVPLTLGTNTITLSMPMEALGDNDDNMDMTAFSLVSAQSLDHIDIAPNTGHGTLGLPGAPSWLQINPSFGVIPNQEGENITITANSAMMEDGLYMAELHIISNDPDSPEILIPVSFEVSGVSNDQPVTAIKDRINANYPNPFNPSTSISFSVSQPAFVEMEIFNIKGQKVSQLIHQNMEKGTHKITWNGNDDKGKNVGSGVYFCRLKVNHQSIDTRKMLLIK